MSKDSDFAKGRETVVEEGGQSPALGRRPFAVEAGSSEVLLRKGDLGHRLRVAAKSVEVAPESGGVSERGAVEDSGEKVPSDRDLLDVKVNGETLRDKIAPLEAFLQGRATEHMVSQWSVAKLVESHTGVRLNPLMDFSPGRILKDLDLWALYSAVPQGHLSKILPLDGRGKVMKQLAQWVSRKWVKEGWVFATDIPFEAVELAGKDRIQMALSCPRVLDDGVNLEELGVRKAIEDPVFAALLDQVNFSVLTHKVMEEDDGHRRSYLLAQASGLRAVEAGYEWPIPHSEAVVYAPSIGLLRYFVYDSSMDDDTEDPVVQEDGLPVEKWEPLNREPKTVKRLKLSAVRENIDARLSLIFFNVKDGKDLFDKDGNLRPLIQEDFITADLIALADAAGIYEEYKEIFRALSYLRQLQFYRNFHIFPQTPDTTRVSLVELLKSLDSPPTVASFGSGNGLLEKILLDQKWASRVIGVDKVDESKDDVVEQFGQHGEGGVTHFGVEQLNLEDPEDAEKLREKIFSTLKQAQVVLATDSLHETDNPKKYLTRLYDETVMPGGYLYVSDPIHCKAVDGITAPALNHFDGTRHPSSMLSLEQYLEVLRYLTLKGAEVVAINIIPGTKAGYTDTLWRLNFILKKPETKKPMPFETPKEGEVVERKVLQGPYEIFEVWPLSLIKDSEEQEIVLQTIGKFPPRLTFDKILDFVVYRLILARNYVDSDSKYWRLPKGLSTLLYQFGVLRKALMSGLKETAFVDLYLTEKKLHPYPPEAVAKLVEYVGVEDDELKDNNRSSALAIAAIQLLESKCAIKLAKQVRNVEGWNLYGF